MTKLRILLLIISHLLVCVACLAGENERLEQARKLADQGKTAASLMMANAIVDRQSLFAEKEKDQTLLVAAYSLCARNYQTLGNLTQSLEYYKRAIRLAQIQHDEAALGKLCNSLFGIYYARHEYEQARRLLEQSLHQSLNQNDTANLCNIYNNFGLISYEQGHFQEALQYMDKALLHTPANNREAQALIHTNRGEVYYKQGLYRQAVQELNRSLSLLKGRNLTPKTLQPLLNMALVKARMGKYRQAQALLQRIAGLLPSMPLPVKANSYRQLAEISFVMQDSLKGLHHMLSYELYNDSLIKTDDESQLQQLLIAYDSERLRQNNDNLQQTVRLRTTITCACACFLVLLSVLLIVLQRRLVANKRKNILINKQKELLRQYEQREHERKQKELTLELDHKNRQLTSYTIDLASINEFHHKILTQLCEMRDSNDKSHPLDTNKQISNIAHQIEHYNDTLIDDDFRTYFDEVHPDFFRQLSQQHSKLSKADLRLCAYLHLGMSTKEIAALTHKEVRSVESSRNRLRKKLDLPNATNIQDFLKDFGTHP